MIRMRYAIGTALLVMMAPMAAVAQDEHAGHHPPAGAEAPATPPKADKPANDRHCAMGGVRESSGMMSGGGQPMHDMMGGKRMSGHIEDHLGRQRSELGITTAQAGAWTAYAEALRKTAADMDRMHRTMSDAASGKAEVSPVDRLDRHDRMLGMMRDALHSLRPALVQLYAALSPEQRLRADGMLMVPGMMRGMPLGKMRDM